MPAGRVSAPANAITPLSPIRMPGVARPWTVSSAVIVENAVPISTARPSR